MKKLIVLLAIFFISGCSACFEYTMEGYSYDRKVYSSLFKKQIVDLKKDEQEKMPGYLAIRIYDNRYLPALSKEISSESGKK